MSEAVAWRVPGIKRRMPRRMHTLACSSIARVATAGQELQKTEECIQSKIFNPKNELFSIYSLMTG
ncbi:hypothetical protein [Escherichia coli]|uniref:hypothetical protein n=1 Tax=Escherichia coli TaxID=562 RepID=UPI00227F4EBE|nr:hypothetical protein [Escherichia coli]